MTLGVYKFEYDCGRMGELSGVFVADSETVKKAIGKTIYFGEVLGKHSDISIEPNEDEIFLVTDDKEAVMMFQKFGFESGYNPLDFMEEEDFLSEDEE